MTTQPLNRLQIAWRAAQDIQEGMLVNLGLGMPVAVADYIRPEVDVFIQAENGVIGVGPLAAPDRADSDLVDLHADAAAVIEHGNASGVMRPGVIGLLEKWHVVFAEFAAGCIGIKFRHFMPERELAVG